MDSIIDELTAKHPAIGITFLALHFKQPEDAIFQSWLRCGREHQEENLKYFWNSVNVDDTAYDESHLSL